jgi:hypothetical protein
MAVDQSLCTIKQRLVTAVWLHERPYSGDAMETVKVKFQDHFGVEPPRKATMLGWKKRAFATGSVKDGPGGGQPITRRETCHTVVASVMQSPVKSTCRRSAELRIPRFTVMDHMKLDLKVRPFHPLHVSELSNADMNARKDACRVLLAAFRSQHGHGAVLFTDECAFSKHCFWAKENPHFYKELERNPPHIMVWAGLSAKDVFGPFFFHGSVTGQAYHDMVANGW